MNLASTAALALSALRRNKLRSLLTMLGIVIGVAAVLAMQAMGRGATAFIGDAIAGLGTNMLVGVPGASRSMGHVTLGVPLFTTADLEAIRRDVPSVSLVSGANSRMLRVVAGASNRTVEVIGATPEYFEIRQWSTAAGRGLTFEDERQAAPVCLIGHALAIALFDLDDPLGREIRIRDLSCRVVGVMVEKGGGALGGNQDELVFMPWTTFSRRIVGTERVSAIIASAVSADRIDEARESMVALLRHRRHIREGEEADFGVHDPREIQALLQTVTGVLTAVLAAVAAVSLVVGGIGVMNIMLVSVTERTREIGIRLAVGARASDILRQFLVESVVLSAVGGVLGIAAGLLAAFGIAHAISIPFVVPPLATPVAFAVSVAVGIAFGVVPARKAARLNPLAALRFE
ncbi:MAG: ABC transporter permease [Deltaproteobacteria bacterium]